MSRYYSLFYVVIALHVVQRCCISSNSQKKKIMHFKWLPDVSVSACVACNGKATVEGCVLRLA